jgi:hypothetical protein
MLGLEPSAIIGRNVWDLYPQVYDNTIGQTMRRAMQERRLVSAVYFSEEGTCHIAHAFPHPDGIRVEFWIRVKREIPG